MCESDTSVAGGTFDYCSAWLEEAAALGVLDYVEGGAVFDGAAGVHEFGFAEDFAAGLIGDFVETDEGGVANCYFPLASTPLMSKVV